MTQKQKNILHVALELFAKQGYASTPTSKIAKQAQVSEGLIFKHFTNKAGLLDAIIEIGRKESEKIFLSLEKINDPTNVIQAILALPFELEEEQYNYWRLLYSIKWQTDVYDKNLTAPFKNILIKSFKRLDYFRPEIEAEIVLSILDGMNTLVLLRNPNDKHILKETLLKRYR